MPAASLTPRVRILAICDDATPSTTEAEVHVLDGIRQRIIAEVFPCRRDLDVYLLLSCPRSGNYDGWVRVVHVESGRVIRHREFSAPFPAGTRFLVIVVSLDNCRFAEPDEYAFEVWFRAKDEESAQKGELPFFVDESED